GGDRHVQPPAFDVKAADASVTPLVRPRGAQERSPPSARTQRRMPAGLAAKKASLRGTNGGILRGRIRSWADILPSSGPNARTGSLTGSPMLTFSRITLATWRQFDEVDLDLEAPL